MKRHMTKQLVVVGNGMSGVACVEQILKQPHDFEITIFGDETHVNRAGYGITPSPWWRAGEQPASYGARPEYPRWTSENRPYVDTSKPANAAEPGQEYLYRGGASSGKHFFMR
jgi:NADPH-dependent 2,4-dienoyl-CoA reductase/sulfur reductase-like enzyme